LLDEIARCFSLQVPDNFRERYIHILFNHQEAISIDKYNLGLAKNYKHKIHLKSEDPVYRKQFNIPEAHQQFIEQTPNPGRKVKTGGSAEIGLAVQFHHLLCPEKARTRTLDNARLLVTEPELPH
jgi:hypothetical protein